jgi:hypothetical protein
VIDWPSSFTYQIIGTPWQRGIGSKDLAESLFKQYLDHLMCHDLTVYISKQIGAKVELNTA